MGRQMEMGVEYKIEYNGTYDIIFKKLFQKSEIAARVIESILDCKINPSDIKYIDSVQSNGVNCKSETFDITIEIIGDDYKYIDLEMQNRIRDYEIADRLMTNLSALITNNTEKGEVYGSTKYYTICFINYPLESDECINTLFKDVSFGLNSHKYTSLT